MNHFEFLRNFKVNKGFQKSNGDILMLSITIPAEEDIMADGRIYLKEKTVKHQGIWNIHLDDKDPWPSDPHGDRVDEAEKLDLYTGNIFSKINRNFIRKFSKKTMKYIYKQIMAHEYANIKDKMNNNLEKITYL